MGIDASRAFLARRTGIEEYSYQVIKNLRQIIASETEVRLYMRPGQGVDFTLPKHWKIKRISSPRFWTQFRLSLELLLHPVDTLFVPAHVVPLIHPRNTAVTIHGLEYEFSPESYSLYDRWYMRLSIFFSCRFAKRVIAVSENTKKDLMKLYSIPEEKISVIPEGCSHESGITNQESGLIHNSEFIIPKKPYFLFIGRLETRKNIIRLIEAFEIFKGESGNEFELVLAGKFGYGGEDIEKKIENSPVRADIILPGYVGEKEKWQLLKNARLFLFPSLYEGFGIPVLEAQSVGVPVITSSTSSLPEVAGDGAVFVDPLKSEEMAEAMEKLLKDMNFRADIIEKALHNVKRFSWERCTRKVFNVLFTSPSRLS